MKEGTPRPTNIINHIQNLALAHGIFYHGVYYLRGEPQVNKKKKKLPNFKNIFKYKPRNGH